MEKEKLNKTNALYPFVAIFSSIVILIGGLLTASNNGWIFLIFIVVLLLLFGMGKNLLKIMPILSFIALLYFGFCFAITHSLQNSLEGVYRIVSLGLAIIPGLSVPYVNLIRCFNQLKFPRSISLGILITFRFYPILTQEIRQVRQAMKTRGCGFSLKVLYRSTIIPFCVQLINISDLLALSVETRGFCLDNRNATVYKKVIFSKKDFAFAVLVTAIFISSLIILPGVCI